MPESMMEPTVNPLQELSDILASQGIDLGTNPLTTRQLIRTLKTFRDKMTKEAVAGETTLEEDRPPSRDFLERVADVDKSSNTDTHAASSKIDSSYARITRALITQAGLSLPDAVQGIFANGLNANVETARLTQSTAELKFSAADCDTAIAHLEKLLLLEGDTPIANPLAAGLNNATPT